MSMPDILIWHFLFSSFLLIGGAIGNTYSSPAEKLSQKEWKYWILASVFPISAEILFTISILILAAKLFQIFFCD